jgi:hypothetical protein
VFVAQTYRLLITLLSRPVPPARTSAAKTADLTHRGEIRRGSKVTVTTFPTVIR